MDIESPGYRIPGKQRVGRGLNIRRSLGTVINRTAVVFHPLPHCRKSFLRPVIEGTSCRGSHVQKKVASLADRFNKKFDQLRRAFPCSFVAIITPRSGESLAGLPRNPLSVYLRPLRNFYLLGSGEVPSSFNISKIEAVVDDYPGLKRPCKLKEILRIPVAASLAVLTGEGEIEPDNAYLTIIGK